MKKKQGTSFFAYLCCMALTLTMVCPAQAVGTSASAAILIDASSGRVLYEQNADTRHLIASTTKIMTALVAIEECDGSERVKITSSHMAEGSSMYLKPGEEWSMETLLYGLMLCSGNDAALAIADHCGPGVDAFVEKMNRKAQELGLQNTSFANPNGLDDEDHYSTARDMAALMAAAMENETFSRIASTKSITVEGRTLVNHNKLLKQYEGCIGGKTGFTKAAGRTLVTCAERDGMRLIAVTLKDGNDWADHAALYDYGFSRYRSDVLAARGTSMTELPVLNGTQTRVSVRFASSFSYPLQDGETIERRCTLPECVFAPVQAGDPAGELVYTLNGQKIGRVALYYGESAARLPRRTDGGFWKNLRA